MAKSRGSTHLAGCLCFCYIMLYIYIYVLYIYIYIYIYCISSIYIYILGLAYWPSCTNSDHDIDHHLEHAAKHQKPHSSHHNMRGLSNFVMKIMPNCTRLGKQGPIKLCISSGWRDGKMMQNVIISLLV